MFIQNNEKGERIAGLREDLGITVEEMAAITDYSVDEYNRLAAERNALFHCIGVG